MSSRPWRARVLLVAAVAATAAGSTAGGLRPAVSQDGAGPPGAVDPSTRTVRIDAVITTNRGRPVPDLSVTDFEVRDGGLVQSLESARLQVPADARRPAEKPEEVDSALTEQAEARKPGARLFAVFLDEYHVGAGRPTESARETVARFLREELRPSDLVVVMKPLDSLLAIRLTHDWRAATDAAGAFSGRLNDYAPRSPLEAQAVGQAPGLAEPARRQIVLSALDALAAHLGGLAEGRKALIVVSEGLGAQARGPARSGLPDVQAVARTANRDNVAVYMLDPRGSAAEPVSDGDPVEPLRALAEQTNGRALMYAPGDRSVLRQASEDLDACYLLSYRVTRPRDGQAHAVQVILRRRDVQVRARAAYWDRPAEVRPAASAAPPRKFDARLPHDSPLIRPWFGAARGAGGLTRVTFTWEPAPGRAGDRRYVAAASVVLSATDSAGTELFRGRVAPLYAAPGDRGARPARAVFDAAPGTVHLEATVEGPDNEELDTDVRELQVADLNRAALVIGTPAVFRTRTAREFAALSADPEAPPVASREFVTAERLLVRVPVYGPSGSPVVTRARLVRFGQSIREFAPMPGSAADAAVQFDVPLGGLSPGEYTLQIVATAAAGRAEIEVRFRVSG